MLASALAQVTQHTLALMALARGLGGIPVTGGTHEESQQVVDKVGEEHSRDGAPWDRIAGALQVPCEQEWAELGPIGKTPLCSPTASAPTPCATQPSTLCPYLTCWNLP